MANKDTTIVTHLTFIGNIYGFLQLGRNFCHWHRKACSTRQNIPWYHAYFVIHLKSMRALLQNAPFKGIILIMVRQYLYVLAHIAHCCGLSVLKRFEKKCPDGLLGI